MASALCNIMSICLYNGDNWVKAMVASMEMKTQKGYKILWRLFCQYDPCFNPSRTVNRLSWDDYGGDVMKYAKAFDLYFYLSAKSGGYHTAFHCYILFLQGITAPALIKVVKPLLIAVKSNTLDENSFEGDWIGVLPFHLQGDKLAQKIAEQSKVEPFDCNLGGRGHWVHYHHLSGSPDNTASDNDALAQPGIRSHPEVHGSNCCSGLQIQWPPR